ncbi:MULTISPECIES: DNA-3-methyladenine glycosylase I [unclassified Rathayibacter]|uniref:DNA-3-methyladenine glycosylase I n=1 Tax=unclassified Rathayibacter TaxID=2609250 RepID=UPI00188C7C1C|nr:MULTISPECIES: DNA-3-methyladenine glycosylase I [unclassified Rathayibacter]MBF4461905.1 DNA-3-methyladenine glycosylase I [Rathayibacter sp. VKM Ac-2879]MBF4504052.1 DNA-3-methyladenine glycosylase I [Rathayibacter sp. VKM Ac-2878]
MSVTDGLIVGDDGKARCAWSGDDPEYRRYHDEEWGVPLRGDRPLFEKVCLEGFQAGLSWITILRKRPRFREVFHDFDLHAVSQMGEEDVERLLADSGIIRNRAKILATIGNASAALRLIAAEGDGALDRLIWSVHTPEPGRVVRSGDVPATTPASLTLSRTLRSAGFRFVGPTTMYALMQSAGVVDDHLTGCFRSSR